MAYHYAFQEFKENQARACITGLRISTKQSVEIAKYLRGRTVGKAKMLLNEVIKKKRAIPFTRFNRDMGHKPGIMSGRYPINASKQFLELLNTVEHNARFKGMSTANLTIKHVLAQNAGKQMRHGRQGRRSMKYSHLEIVVEEAPGAQHEKKAKASTEKNTDKQPEGTA